MTVARIQPAFASAPSEPNGKTSSAKERRLNFRASEGFVELLGQLKMGYGISWSESIRRGVALLLTAKKASDKGFSLALVDGEGKLVTEIYNF